MSSFQIISSQPNQDLSKLSSSTKLGELLQLADLVSPLQIELALQEQIYQSPELKIGEILALRGWLKPETADFFAHLWPTLLHQKRSLPLGYYLTEAALLDDRQISTILAKQKHRHKHRQSWLKFGELVVVKGWLKQTTIDFFLYPLTSGNFQSPKLENSWPGS